MSNSQAGSVFWLGQPAAYCVQFIVEQTKLAAILHRAVVSLANQRPLLELVRKNFKNSNLRTAPVDQLLSQQAQLGHWAKEIINEDFHRINTYAVVGVWTAIEVAIEDTVIAALQQFPEAFAQLKAAGVKLPQDLSCPLSEADAHRVFSRLERTLRHNRSVADGYSTMLAAVGIRLLIDAESSSLLNEFNYVRNCILHRGGRVDSRAADEAPDLGVPEGELLRIESKRFLKYYDSAGKFATSLLSAASAYKPAPSASS